MTRQPEWQATFSATRSNAPARDATHWHSTTDRLGRVVTFITSTEAMVEAVAVCSILDPASAAPSYRLVDGECRGLDRDDLYPATGLIVFGNHKGNRLTLDALRALTGLHGACAAEAVAAAIARLDR